MTLEAMVETLQEQVRMLQEAGHPIVTLEVRDKFDIGAEFFPWLPVRWLGTIHYNTFSKLPRITVPVMVMHSRRDGLIGFHHGEKNFAAANEPKLFCELKGGHNDSMLDQEGFIAGIEKFLRLIEASKGQTVGAQK